METTSPSVSAGQSHTLRAILIGGMIAGALELIAAFMDFGWGVPRAIAGGVLGGGAIFSKRRGAN